MRPGPARRVCAAPGIRRRSIVTNNDVLALRGGAGGALRDPQHALLMLLPGQMTFLDAMGRIADIAAAAIPGADGVGLTLVAARDADTIVATAPFVAELEALQHSGEDGPSIIAELEGHAVHSSSVSTDDRWSRFGARAEQFGVHSVLSLPLRADDGLLGVLSVYALEEGDVFDDPTRLVGELFAGPAAIAVFNAQVLDQARRLVQQLQSVLAHRAVIDRAIGILRARHGCTAEDASDLLRQMSRTQHRPLPALAQTLIDDAVRLALAGHIPD
ncbi:MAG: hypothetical protein QOC73_299 [Actinomycetota bacterium]|nr:hypothetical protein [Actinomycetota bacterium]